VVAEGVLIVCVVNFTRKQYVHSHGTGKGATLTRWAGDVAPQANTFLRGKVSRQNQPQRIFYPVRLIAVVLNDQLATAEAEVSMKSFALKLQRFLKSEDGPTAVEYAVMLALIVIVCLTAIQSVGTNASTTFGNVANSIGGS
jgi:pilus assembly protein Flp/PilA